MKKINILHLYYDLANLSGDSGNIKAITRILDEQKVPYNLDKLSLDDDIKFSKYDLVYLGHMNYEVQELIRKDLLKYKKDLLDAIENGLYFISTGNSYELFGKSINGKKALNLFGFESKQVTNIVSDEELQNLERLVSEAICYMKDFDYPIIGFYNHGNEHTNKDNILFNVKKGFASASLMTTEGVHKYHFYGTYLLGPLLVRNPYLLDKIMKDLLTDRNIPFKAKDSLDKIAYKEYLRNFKIDIK
jgi:CobQ-like glutamine amidotransferase family enzyme